MTILKIDINMKKNKILSVFTMLLLVVLTTNCSDKWDEHTKVNSDVNTVSLFEFIKSDSKYSKFTQLVEETEIDKLLNSSVVYSLFAPTNAAIDAVPEELLNSAENKEQFVKQHIFDRKLVATNQNLPNKIKMLNGKFLVVDLKNNIIDNIELTGEVAIVKNGAIYTLEEAIVPRKSIWELIESYSGSNEQIKFLNSLSKLTFDPEISEELGYNENGQIVYDSAFVYKNQFNLEIANLASEDSLITLFVVNDECFTSEFAKFNKYFRKYKTGKDDDPNGQDSIVIRTELLKDYLFNEPYSLNELPSKIYSINNVNVPINKGLITSTLKASNGYIHFIDEITLELNEKIQEIKIEAEQLNKYFGIGKDLGSAQGYLRKNPKASGGMDYVLDNHGSSNLVNGLILDGGILPSVRYKVYWRAVNDFEGSMRNKNPNLVISQRINTIKAASYDDMGNVIALTGQNTGAINTGYIQVELTEYSDNPEDDEVFIGNYNNLIYEQKYFQLLPEANRMAVTLDYIKLVPDFN